MAIIAAKLAAADAAAAASAPRLGLAAPPQRAPPAGASPISWRDAEATPALDAAAARAAVATLTGRGGLGRIVCSEGRD